MIIVRSQWGRYNLPRCLFDPGIRIPRTPLTVQGAASLQWQISTTFSKPTQKFLGQGRIQARSYLRVKKHGAILISDQFRWKIHQHFVILGWAMVGLCQPISSNLFLLSIEPRRSITPISTDPPHRCRISAEKYTIGSHPDGGFLDRTQAVKSVG